MPRVNLGTPTPAQQRAVMNKIIKKAMVDCDIEDYTALGLRMGMSRQAVSRRMNDGGWKDEELWRLVRVLKLTAEQLAGKTGWYESREIGTRPCCHGSKNASILSVILCIIARSLIKNIELRRLRRESVTKINTGGIPCLF